VVLPAVASGTDELEILRASTTCALGRFGGLVLVNWRSQVTQADVRALIQARDELRKSGRFVGALHIAEAGLPVPDEAVRQTAQRGFEGRRDQTSAIALVVLGEGFAASAIRSVGTAVFALRGIPTRLFADTDAAAKWMVDEMQAYRDERALAAACRSLRAAGS
jgi:hypothetical protein